MHGDAAFSDEVRTLVLSKNVVDYVLKDHLHNLDYLVDRRFAWRTGNHSNATRLDTISAISGASTSLPRRGCSASAGGSRHLVCI